MKIKNRTFQAIENLEKEVLKSHKHIEYFITDGDKQGVRELHCHSANCPQLRRIQNQLSILRKLKKMLGL